MTESDVATADALKAQIDEITTVQAAIAATGSKGAIAVLDSTGANAANAAALTLALGATEYANQCANAVTALSTALASAKTTAQDALTAL
jgi:copper homeostasis protein CutC